MSNKMFKFAEAMFPQRASFDLSYEKKFTADMGNLYPVLCEEMIPGDTFKIGNQIVARMMPMVAPVLHEINIFVHYFVVPYRLLMTEELGDDGSWEDFYTGGANGQSAPTLPLWNGSNTGYSAVGTLWDYLGFPVATNMDGVDMYPLDFPRRAYYFIWNEYYRPQHLVAELDITDQVNNVSIMWRCWEKDYFTSAMLWQQRGTAPALPITGTINTSAVFPGDLAVQGQLGISNEMHDIFGHRAYGDQWITLYTSQTDPAQEAAINIRNGKVLQANANNNTVSVNLSSATTFNVSDLRLAFQVQKFLERSARSGARYTEFLRAHFGVSPRDDRLQRPEYIGGTFGRVNISEVLQTSETSGTPQGTMAGHGICVDAQYAGTYTATEPCLIMGLLSIMPKPAYSQGLNRQWTRQTRYDFPFPEFVGLSEQAIEGGEIYLDSEGSFNRSVWGYQGRFDELRYKPNQVCGLMRPLTENVQLSFWHLSRFFSSRPDLNDVFVQCNPDKRIFAAENEPGFLISFGNIVHAMRPIPHIGRPGLIDHF